MSPANGFALLLYCLLVFFRSLESELRFLESGYGSLVVLSLLTVAAKCSVPFTGSAAVLSRILVDRSSFS